MNHKLDEFRSIDDGLRAIQRVGLKRAAGMRRQQQTPEERSASLERDVDNLEYAVEAMTKFRDNGVHALIPAVGAQRDSILTPEELEQRMKEYFSSEKFSKGYQHAQRRVMDVGRILSRNPVLSFPRNPRLTLGALEHFQALDYALRLFKAVQIGHIETFYGAITKSAADKQVVPASAEQKAALLDANNTLCEFHRRPVPGLLDLVEETYSAGAVNDLLHEQYVRHWGAEERVARDLGLPLARLLVRKGYRATGIDDDLPRMLTRD